MRTLYEDLKQGLQEAIEYQNGTGKAHVNRLKFKGVRFYSPFEIREIRRKAGMSQKVFATYMGVSNKTVEAWERGRVHPTGPALRLIELLDKDQELALLLIEKDNDRHLAQE